MVITKLKPHFARYGIPDTVMSDNGPQFISDEFRRFGKSWGFEHITSSPHHSRSNGKVESSVKAAKRMIRKAKMSGEDQYLALLNIRNTPTQGMDSSPAQRLLGRRTKTIVPTTHHLLESQITTPQHETKMLKRLQNRQSAYYNRSATDLPILHEGETVRIKPYKLGDKKWKKAKVIERLDERSYEVEDSDGTVYRRNRVHLKKTHEQPSHMLHNEPDSTILGPEVEPVQPIQPTQLTQPEPTIPQSTTTPTSPS